MTVLADIVLAGRAWLGPCVLALAVLAVALMWSARRQTAARWVLVVCGALKFAGAAALAWCLLEPLWVSQRARPGANVFALMADNSQSLQIIDSGERQSRGELLRAGLAADPGGWQAALEKNFQVRRYLFDTRLQNARDFGELNFAGRGTALGAALRTAAERWRGQPVAGVLLFTDGNATDVTGDFAGLEGCPPFSRWSWGATAGCGTSAWRKWR